MRFYRVFFWLAVFLHLALAAWLCLAPDYALRQLGHDAAKVPLIYIQEHGLFMFIQACAYAYVAERPNKSIPVVTLAVMVNVLLPLFALAGYYSRAEVSASHVEFQLGASGFMLPFLISYYFWFYHTPRPDRFMPFLGIFGERR